MARPQPQPATMGHAKAPSAHYHGSLVALEGPQEMALIQLRLLPLSSKVLVLPPLDDFTKQDDPAADFDARSYILSVHEACIARFEAAISFLREATPANKRLVFMPGGTASAQRSCIYAISEHLTDGDNTRAEIIFNKFVRGGVAGLRGPTNATSRSSLHSRRASREDGSTENVPAVYVDAASQAMAAADALDRETESLQPNTDVDLSIFGHKRSISVPMRRVDGELEEPTPFYVFGKIHRPSSDTIVVPQTPGPWSPAFSAKTGTTVDRRGYERLFEPSKPATTRDNLLRLSAVPQSAPQSPVPPIRAKSYLRLSMASSAPVDVASPRTVAFGSPPETPVTYGRAAMVDVRSSQSFTTSESSTPRFHKRVRSLDRIYGGAVANQDISAGSSRQTFGAHAYETESTSGSVSPKKHAAARLSTSTFSETTQGTFTKATQTTIRRPPPKPLDLSKAVSIRERQYVTTGTSPLKGYTDKATWTEKTFYVDQGAYCGETPMECVSEPRAAYLNDNAEPQANEAFETVLPVYEDLVIQLQDENSDLLLESIIEGFKTGKYPVTFPLVLLHDTESNLEPLETPSSPTSMTSSRTSAMSSAMPTPLYLPPCRPSEDEYDPFAAHGSSLQPPTEWVAKVNLAQNPTTTISTKPRRQSGIPFGAKYEATGTDFHEIKTICYKTPVGVQNMVRYILNDYFSPETPGFHHFKLLPELGSLWRPVFRGEDTRELSGPSEKLDLILAVGSQQGVAKELLSSITGCLEKLGTKPNGVTRSGRLDLRYLIANAVQCHFSWDSDSEQEVNLLENPLLLATLIIPHLETYLAAHCKTQYLILEYQPEHLSVIMALQRLIGVTLFKVAGILNADSHETKSTRASISTNAELEQVIRSSIHRASLLASPTLMSLSGSVPSEAPRFSKANFLLTSSATESEISTFISTIWKVLVDISPFYIPEGSPRPSQSERKVSKCEGSNMPELVAPNADYTAYKSAADLLGFVTPPLSPLPDGSSSDVAPVTKVTTYPPKEHQVVVVNSTAPQMRRSKSVRTLASRSQRNHIHRYLTQDIGNDNERRSVRGGAHPGSIMSELSDDEEGQGRFWADERRYMPLFLREREARKGNSRKALKFLGLAN